jgi:hypothetical protein
MKEKLTEVGPQRHSGHNRASTDPASHAFASRMANVALTAQVQFSYACAVAAGAHAERTAVYIENSWPDTPLRTLVVAAYRAQLKQSQLAASGILQKARERCGLAFARLPG